MTSPALRRAAPLAAAVAVLAVVAGATYAFRETGGAPGSSSAPPPLRIGAATDRAAAADARYTVRGTLPDGPEEASVRRFTAGDPDVARVAAALGVDPDDVTGGESVTTDGSDLLRVGSGPGRPWQFVRADAAVCLEPLPGASPDSSVSSCAVPPADGRPAVEPAPSRQAALDRAAPVLHAVGLEADDAVVGEPGSTGDTRTVRVEPLVEGVPTAGLATTVTVDADGVVAAEGWLGGTREGDRYPVISAAAALDRLAAMPVPLIGCPEGEQRPPAPLCGGPLEVTGASFGLSLQHEDEKPLLVPSWLFDVAGGTEPLSVVAVEAAYLDPMTGSGSTGSGSDGSGGAGASPGTAQPQPVEPVAPKVEPTPATSRFESVRPADGGASLTVTFYGGVEDCYTYDVLVEETSRSVSLRLAERRTGDVCIDLAQHYERTVRLSRPLGSRAVLDAQTRMPLHPVRAE